ncbi:MAG: ABC transporter permease, partial [Verrucomicrobiae bacterium]|nr:ABC transporter permease [Verrucomicrobiae bacterium]
REIAAYFLSPIAYLGMLAFLVLTGVGFWMLVMALDGRSNDVSVMQLFFGSFFYWIGMLMAVPVITMRLFAEEKRLGTIETLMTAPVSDAAVVWSKFLGATAFFALLWLPTSAYSWLLNQFANAPTPIDWGPVIAAYLGTLLIGSFYVSLGLLASSWTQNQIVAAIVGFVLITVIFFLGFLTSIGPAWLQSFCGYISSIEHMRDFSRGQIDLRRIILYVSATVFVLFWTQKVIESRKWR